MSNVTQELIGGSSVNLTMDESVASNFKNIMQQVYDFLKVCEDQLNSCVVIEHLGYDNGKIGETKTAIEKTIAELEGLTRDVTNCQGEVFATDENSARWLSEEVWDLFDENGGAEEADPEAPVVPYVPSGGGHGRPPTTPSTSEPIAPQTPSEFKPYQFSEDTEEAYRLGDIFVDDEMSLTKFTNILLERYQISDKKVAKKLYETILIYGNEYFYENGQNPLNVLSEDEVLSSLYAILKEDFGDIPEESFWETLKDVRISDN